MTYRRRATGVADVTAGGAGQSAYRRPAHVAYVVDDAAGGCCVLLHLPSGRRTVLSLTASAAWEALVSAGASGVGADDLAATLAAAYEADPGQVAADVRRLLEQLAAAGLVEPA